MLPPELGGVSLEEEEVEEEQEEEEEDPNAVLAELEDDENAAMLAVLQEQEAEEEGQRAGLAGTKRPRPSGAASSPARGRPRLGDNASAAAPVAADASTLDDGVLHTGRGLPLSQLLEAVPCSRGELSAGLARLGAYQHPSTLAYHAVSPALLAAVMETVLAGATQHGWDFGALPLAAVEEHAGKPRASVAAATGTLTTYPGFGASVVRHVLGWFVADEEGGASNNSSSSSDSAPVTARWIPLPSDATTLALDFDLLAQHVAVRVLRDGWSPAAAPGTALPRTTRRGTNGLRGAATTTVGALPVVPIFEAPVALPSYPPMRLPAFLAAWEAGLPHGCVKGSDSGDGSGVVAVAGSGNGWGGILSVPRVLAGAGLALVHAAGTSVGLSGASISYFPEPELSPDPKTRFAQLFTARPKWTLAELAPFIDSLCGYGRTQGDLLLGHTRQTLVPGGATLFSAKAK